jgi:hypothetical protein
MIDSWNPDNLVVINLEQGISGNLCFELPGGIMIGITSKIEARKHIVFKGDVPEWAEDFALFHEDGTPVFRFSIFLFWGQSTMIPDDLSHNKAWANIYGIQINDRDTMYMHGGGGGRDTRYDYD